MYRLYLNRSDWPKTRRANIWETTDGAEAAEKLKEWVEFNRETLDRDPSAPRRTYYLVYEETE